MTARQRDLRRGNMAGQYHREEGKFKPAVTPPDLPPEGEREVRKIVARSSLSSLLLIRHQLGGGMGVEGLGPGVDTGGGGAVSGDGAGSSCTGPVTVTPMCSMRILRTSSMANGCPWQECPERTINSDSTPSMWALWYSTTPSLPVWISMPGSTATME
jgi:hypothetical protein